VIKGRLLLAPGMVNKFNIQSSHSQVHGLPGPVTSTSRLQVAVAMALVGLFPKWQWRMANARVADAAYMARARKQHANKQKQMANENSSCKLSARA
jgi:hypothetical protein